MGANLFIGNLDPVSSYIVMVVTGELAILDLTIVTKLWCLFQDVDEKLLYDTFSAFGVIVTNPKVITFPLNPITHLCFFLEDSR